MTEDDETSITIAATPDDGTSWRTNYYQHYNQVAGTQTTRTSQEDMAPTDQGRHDGRGCGPRPAGVEKKDKADP